MPATSKAQQRLFGLAYAIKKGDMKRSDADAKAVELADSMSLKDLKKFAETDHDGLPDKVKEGLVTEGKGYTEARKLIDSLRAKTYRKLNDDELWEFKKEMVDHLGGTLEEGISPASMGGMGAVAFPSDTSGTADGSGDVPAGKGDAEEEYKKKKKKRDAEIEKQKNESMIFTDFNTFLNEEYQPNGKYNTVAKVRKKLGPRASEKTVAEFIIANLKDVTGIGPKELRDGYKTDQALDKVADIAAFYKFDDIEWNTAFQDAINNAPYDWEVDYNFESVNEAFYPSTQIGSIRTQKDIDKFDKDSFVQKMYNQGRIRVDELDISYDDEWQIFIDKKDKEVIKFLKKNYSQHLQIDSYLAKQLAESVNEALNKSDITYQLSTDYSGNSKPKITKLNKKEIQIMYGYKVNPQDVIDSIKKIHPEVELEHLGWSSKSTGGGFHKFAIKESIDINEGEISDTFDLILDTINKYKKIKPVKPYFNAAKRMALKSKGLKNLKDIRDHLDKTLKDFTVTKISKGDYYPTQESFNVINKKTRKIYSIAMDLEEPGEFDITYSDLNESIDEAKIKDAREDLGYVSFLKEMGELNAKDLQRAYQSAVNVLINEKGMTEKEAVGFLNSPHGKYMAEYLIPGQDFSFYAFLDKLEEYYNERMLKKYAKDYKGLAK